MTPSSNSEARKRAETRPSGDPVDALRALADEISEACEVRDVWLTSISDRLDRLAGQVVPRPPTVSEIIAHLDAGGLVESQGSYSGKWVAIHSREFWADSIACYGDRPVSGCRLTPIPAPTTERVRLDQVIGRRLPGERWPIDEVVGDPAAWGWKPHVGGEERTLPVDADGTVEVLVEGDQ